MGLLLCFVMPVFSWCSFTTSVANSKMKLPVWNRGLGHRVLCLRVLGWLFLIAVKQVSASDVAAVGALEQVSFSKEIKLESQRLNITHFSRVFLFYSTNKKTCVLWTIHRKLQTGKFHIQWVLLPQQYILLSGSFSRFGCICPLCSSDYWYTLSCLLQSGIILLVLIFKQFVAQEPFTLAHFVAVQQYRGTAQQNLKKLHPHKVVCTWVSTGTEKA